MKKVLARLDRRWTQAASHELCERLAEFFATNQQASKSQHILAWTTFFPGEPDLSQFIGRELSRRSVYLPRILPDRSMKFVAIGADWSEAVSAGPQGIPEPSESSGAIFDPQWGAGTIVLVPGLVFTVQGGRLGRAGGYYDRFLSSANMSDALKIATCWSLAIVPSIPLEPHDVMMDWICTEEGFLSCSG